MKFLCVIFICFQIILTVVTTKVIAQDLSSNSNILKGKIEDPNGARVSDVELVIENKFDKRVVKTNDYGEYETHIPKGIYTIKISKNGFCSSYRPEFEVAKNDIINFDFVLIPCGIKHGFSDGYKPSEYSTSNNPFNQELKKSNKNFTLLIRYGVVKKEKHKFEYVGFETKFLAIDEKGSKLVLTSSQPVVVMFNKLTVKAEKVILINDENKLIACGNVEWQDNKQSAKAEKIIIEFKQEDFIINDEKNCKCNFGCK